MNTTNTHDYSIVLAGHGSRDNEGIQEFEQAVDLLKTSDSNRLIRHGYLEFATPTISDAIRDIINEGAKNIVMLPTILFAASHGKNDMPIEMLTMKKEFPNIDFHYGGALELHPLLLKLFQKHIIDCEAQSSKIVKRSETLLVVVGRGTTDSDINSNVNKLARMIEEGMGFGSSYVCYSGTAKPLVADGIEFATTMGFKRLIVIPYFLFTGVLVKRIYAAADEVKARHPEIEILNANYLGVHENVIEVWKEKAIEALEGRSTMNCTLCKYRTQIVGYEEEVGTTQRAHHLHVRGSDEAHEHPHSHEHSHHHSHEGVSEKHEPQVYIPHPIEAESFEIIKKGADWSQIPEIHQPVIQRLVHTSGDFSIIDDIVISEGAIEIGIDALMKEIPIATDVTMVKSGLKRVILPQLGINVFCGVHDDETKLLAEATKLTRSAAGIRRIFEKFGNDVILAIGDAPTAVMESVRLINEQQWRPRLIIGLPVGFVGTKECKAALQQCKEVPYITNEGNRGGSPWAAATINALMIQAVNRLATS